MREFENLAEHLTEIEKAIGGIKMRNILNDRNLDTVER